MVTIFPLRWERARYNNISNIVNVKVTAIDQNGNIMVFNKAYREWFGVCTGNIKKVKFNIEKYFPTCQVFCTKLSNTPFKKVLPYFKDRLIKNKLAYSSKIFYKVYTTAPIEDVGSFFDKKKIAYYSREDWLNRIYIDFGVRYNTSEFYYKWYKVDDSKTFLIDSFEMLPSEKSKPEITIASFDLETAPLDGENRVPTGHHMTDRIVMISIVKWSFSKDPERIVLYLNPSGKSLGLRGDTYREFFDEKSMLLEFHRLIRDVNVLTGYNINNFDLPCIFARLTWLNMRSVLNEYYSRKIGEVTVPTYQNKLIVDMYNFIQTFSSYDVPSYKLDDVARVKLKSQKVDIKSISIHCWYTQPVMHRLLLLSTDVSECFRILQPRYVREEEFGTFLTCLKYCLHDSELVYLLFKQQNALDFLIERSNFTTLNIEQSLYYGTSKYIFDIFKTYGAYLGFFVNANHFKNTLVEDGEPLQSFFVGPTYQGALNYCRPASFYKDVYVFDFTSMYPSILLNQNLCYGTSAIMDVSDYDALPAEIREQCEAVPYRNHRDTDFEACSMTPKDRYRHPEIDRERDTAVMVWYKEELGFMPLLVQHFLKKRKEYRRLEKEGDAVDFHNKQLNIKLFLNSIYGCMASMDTVFSRLHIAMIITAFARIYILASAEYFTAQGKLVAYSDTDSIFVQGYGSTQCSEVNVYLGQPHMTLAFERIMDYLLVISKKRYVYVENGKPPVKKGFEKKSNDLVKFMSTNIINGIMKGLMTGDTDVSNGWIILVETLVRAYAMCHNPRKFCITRKTKKLSEYKSKNCPIVNFLKMYPDMAGQPIDYTYSQTDTSVVNASRWIMSVDDCEYVNFEKLFINQKKIFLTLLQIVFIKHIPDQEYRMILNTMKWKQFLNAELLHFNKTGQNIMILVEKSIKYTFEINDH